jgi:NADPH-dependent 2,4-dienoyl-CoA reductase/sulfur reductase-like enzyme
MKRRSALGLMAGAGLGWNRLVAANTPVPGRAGPQRVVVIGGAWAGLSAARTLRQAAPELDVLVLDRDPVFRPLPLSNPWLVDRTAERLPRLDRATLARRLGYRFLATDVLRIDRAQRQVDTPQGQVGYDWLVLASGIAYDDSAWYGQNTQAAELARTRFPGGFMAHELDRLKQGLMAFQGGDLVMTVPPAPLRCPPAPYERAMLIGWWLKTRGIKGKLIVLDAGGGMPRFTRLFGERYPGQIEFRPYSTVRSVDPFAQQISTDDGEQHFDHALLLPPMRASALVQGAGLLGTDAKGGLSQWAGPDPHRGHAMADDRVYLAGDLVGAVSPLFGHYPKTAHIASMMGREVARQIAARSRGDTPPAAGLPHSECHVWLDGDPAEQLRIEAHYRLRGDGVILQTITQHDNPQPRDEDLLWARQLMAVSLGV